MNHRRTLLLLSFLFVPVCMAVDYLTGPRIFFPIFYLLPFSIISYHLPLRLSLPIVILLPFTRFFFHREWQSDFLLFETIINTFSRILIFTAISFLINSLAEKTRKLSRDIGLMAGILPICAECKRIRNENGEYVALENYISDHSRTRFSHDICPECMRKLYPELFNREKL